MIRLIWMLLSSGDLAARFPDRPRHHHRRLRQDIRPIPGCNQSAVLLPVAERQDPRRDVRLHGGGTVPAAHGVVWLHIYPADGAIELRRTWTLLHHEYTRGETPRYKGGWTLEIFCSFTCELVCFLLHMLWIVTLETGSFVISAFAVNLRMIIHINDFFIPFTVFGFAFPLFPSAQTSDIQQ